MFHFPAFPPHSLYIQLQVTPHNMVRGFPIRKSWSQRPVIDSTRLIADSHVLHRLLMPRHPPCALKNFNTKQSSQKLSYKTINKITTNKTQTPHTPRTGTCNSSCLQDARVHYTVPKQQPRTPTQHPQPAKRPATRTPCSRHRTNTETPSTQPPHPTRSKTARRLVASKPNSAPNIPIRITHHARPSNTTNPQRSRHCVLNHTHHTTQTMPTPEPPKTPPPWQPFRKPVSRC